MNTFESRYYYYRRFGYHPVRTLIMAMPLWLSMAIIPVVIQIMFLLLLKIV